MPLTSDTQPSGEPKWPLCYFCLPCSYSVPAQIKQAAETELEVGQKKADETHSYSARCQEMCRPPGHKHIHIWGLFLEQSTTNMGAGLDIN